jgi:serine phosphatase RsbU (regulator of sigma subunit)
MFDRLAIKTTLSIFGLGILFFVLHINLYVIPFSDSGQFFKTIDQVYAADMTPSGEQVHPPASELPLFKRRLDGYEFIVAVLLTFLGIITIVLACWRWEKKDLALLSFGAFCLLWGARLNLLRFLFEPSARSWEYASWLFTYLVPVPGFIFAEQILGRGWKSSIRRLWQIAIVVAIVSIAVGIYSAKPWAAHKANNILAIAGLLIIIFNLFRPGVSRNKEIRVLRVGFIIYAVFAIHANLAHYLFTGPLAQDLEPVGLLIVGSCLGYLVARRFFQNQKDLVTIEHELETARQIQSFILPQQMAEIKKLKIGARYVPMATMAGDFYDFLVIDENRIGVLVADVSGHGVPASLIASMVKIAFVSQTPCAADPARVLAGLNQMLCGKLESDFVTAGYLFIDTEEQSAAYAGAGHPPLLLYRRRENEILEITEKSVILGQVDDTEYRNSRLKLRQGDRFVLYTDGIVEALNPAGEIFGADRLKAFIKANSALTIDPFCDRLLETITDWASGGSKVSRDDDLTLLAIDYEAAGL